MREVKERFDKGYTMSIYGTREALHEQMRSDIEMLLQALNLDFVSGSALDFEDIETINNALHASKKNVVRSSNAYNKVNATHRKVKELIRHYR